MLNREPLAIVASTSLCAVRGRSAAAPCSPSASARLANDRETPRFRLTAILEGGPRQKCPHRGPANECRDQARL